MVMTMSPPPIINYVENINDDKKVKSCGLYKKRSLGSNQVEISYIPTNKMEDKGNTMYYDYAVSSGVKVMHGTVKTYFIELAKKNEFVSMNNKIIGGVPAVSGHRISVSLIVACLRDGMSLEEISDDYNISVNVLEGVLEYVVSILDKPYESEEL